jgi:Tfp pilus assembly protein FimT
MLTVMVIIGIIIAVAVPVMNSFSRAAGLQGAVREVSNTLQLARQFAITHRVRTEVTVTNTYNAICVRTNNWPVDKWKFLPAGAAFSNVPVNITFKPTGDLTAPNDQKIYIYEGVYDTNLNKLVATTKNAATVTVSSVLGKVTVQTP